jgi:hypothetical protein
MTKLDKNAFYILISIVVFLLVYPVIENGKYAFTQTGSATVFSFWCEEVLRSGSYSYTTSVCAINLTAKNFFLSSLVLAILAFLIRVDVISIHRIVNYIKNLNQNAEAEQKPEDVDKQ